MDRELLVVLWLLSPLPVWWLATKPESDPLGDRPWFVWLAIVWFAGPVALLIVFAVRGLF